MSLPSHGRGFRWGRRPRDADFISAGCSALRKLYSCWHCQDFRLTKGGKLNKGIFEGSTINTPSMLANEDWLATLKWAESVGGLKQLIQRTNENLSVFEAFVAKNNWIHFLAETKETRSSTSVCFKVDLSDEKLKELIKTLEKEKVAYDIGSYRDAPSGLRIWCGATVEKEDLELPL
jgi:phosphoserine aminotransferase